MTDDVDAYLLLVSCRNRLVLEESLEDRTRSVLNSHFNDSSILLPPPSLPRSIDE
jgi:hypothetical protein